MKKFLALLCALTLALSLAVPMAGAKWKVPTLELPAFQEAALLEYIMGSLGGIDPNAPFAKKTITREDAAVLAATVALGDKAQAYLGVVPAKAPFSDVSLTNPAAAAIAYCQETGMMDGLGDGTFQPNEAATGSAVAKMLLVAVGYGQKGEFTGSNWDDRVAKAANEAQLLTGGAGNDVVLLGGSDEENAGNGLPHDRPNTNLPETVLDQPATQETAAVMAVTALFQIPMVELNAGRTAYQAATNADGTPKYLASGFSAVIHTPTLEIPSHQIIPTTLEFGPTHWHEESATTVTKQELLDWYDEYQPSYAKPALALLPDAANGFSASPLTDAALRDILSRTGPAVYTRISYTVSAEYAFCWIETYPWTIEQTDDAVTARRQNGSETLTVQLEKHSIRVEAGDYSADGFRADGQQYRYAKDFTGDRIYGGGYDVWVLPKAVTDDMGLTDGLYALYAVDTEPDSDSGPSVFTREVYSRGGGDTTWQYSDLATGAYESAATAALPEGSDIPFGYCAITWTDGRITAVTPLHERAEYETETLPQLTDAVPIYLAQSGDRTNPLTRISLSELEAAEHDYTYDILYTDSGKDFPSCVIVFPAMVD